jgi:hypothetical protein
MDIKKPVPIGVRAFSPAYQMLIVAFPVASIMAFIPLVNLDAEFWARLIAASVSIPFIAIFVLYARRRRDREIARVQQSRNDFAKQIVEAIADNAATPPFTLFLRPFFTDGKIIDADGLEPSIAAIGISLMERGSAADGERAFAQLFEKRAPLIALGRPDLRLGAGKVDAENLNWRETVLALARRAERIIVVPLAQPATLWELEQIAADETLRSKTVFLVPNNRGGLASRFAPDESLKSIRSIWEWSRAKLRLAFPHMPAFQGGVRLLGVTKSGAFLPSYGDGFSRVTQPSGMKPLLVDGVTVKPSFWKLVILLPVLAAFFALPFPVSSATPELNDLLQPGVPLLSGDLVWFLQILVYIGVLLGIYGLLTDSNPVWYSIIWSSLFLLLFVAIRILAFPWWQELPINDPERMEQLRWSHAHIYLFEWYWRVGQWLAPGQGWAYPHTTPVAWVNFLLTQLSEGIAFALIFLIVFQRRIFWLTLGAVFAAALLLVPIDHFWINPAIEAFGENASIAWINASTRAEMPRDYFVMMFATAPAMKSILFGGALGSVFAWSISKKIWYVVSGALLAAAFQYASILISSFIVMFLWSDAFQAYDDQSRSIIDSDFLVFALRQISFLVELSVFLMFAWLLTKGATWRRLHRWRDPLPRAWGPVR